MRMRGVFLFFLFLPCLHASTAVNTITNNGFKYIIKTDSFTFDKAKQTCSDAGSEYSLLWVSYETELKWLTDNTAVPGTIFWGGMQNSATSWVNGQKVTINGLSASLTGKCLSFQLWGATPAWVPQTCHNSYKVICKSGGTTASTAHLTSHIARASGCEGACAHFRMAARGRGQTSARVTAVTQINVSVIECARYCLGNTGCGSFVYNSVKKSCVLLEKIDESGWTVDSKSSIYEKQN